jgi:hypothetical protein
MEKAKIESLPILTINKNKINAFSSKASLGGAEEAKRREGE